MFNGETGGGKSYATLRLAYEVSQIFNTPFTIEGNLDFKFDKLMKKMMNPDLQKKGTVFVMEETGAVGSGSSSREWQSQANKFFFSFLQTSRHRNQIFIMNCPSFSYLEKGARELVHAQFEAIGINYKLKKSYFKPFILQVNRRSGKIYFKYLRFKVDGVKRKMNVINFSLPPDNLIEPYEKAKTDFTNDLNLSMIETKADIDAKLKKFSIDFHIIYKALNEGMKPREIRDKLNYSIDKINNERRKIKEWEKVKHLQQKPNKNGGHTVDSQEMTVIITKMGIFNSKIKKSKKIENIKNKVLVEQYMGGGSTLWRKFWVTDPKKIKFWKMLANNEHKMVNITTKVIE